MVDRLMHGVNDTVTSWAVDRNYGLDYLALSQLPYAKKSDDI